MATTRRWTRNLGVALCSIVAIGCGATPPAEDVPTCAEYCDQVMSSCTEGTAQYPDRDSCEASCLAFAAGELDDASGNTIGCRIFHAGAAAVDAETHCAHAGPGGASTCGSNCDGFCAVAREVCTGDNEVYANDKGCRADCATFPDT